MSKLQRKRKREKYIKSFHDRYGMTRKEFRELKKYSPTTANRLRQIAYKKISWTY
jgi:hypothetical protein